MQGLVARLSATPGRLRWAGRPLGADTEAVLAELDALDPHPTVPELSLIHISEPTRPYQITYAAFCLKKKKTTKLVDMWSHTGGDRSHLYHYQR